MDPYIICHKIESSENCVRKVSLFFELPVQLRVSRQPLADVRLA